MILRCRIMTFYTTTLGVALLCIIFWCWFEFKEQKEIVLREGVAGAMRESPFTETMEVFLFGGLPAIFITIIGGHLLMTRALKPITALTEQLEKTDVSNLATPVQRSGNGDELDRMAAVFNHMKERLGFSFNQTREFTLHASHELKTPLTVLHGTLEQMLEHPEDCANQRKERVASMLEEVQRLSVIVGQLAFLAKADAGQSHTTFSEVQLHELVRELEDDLVMLSHSADVTVALQQVEEARVLGDRMRLRQLLLILGDNAVKYNVAGGTISVSLLIQQDKACFSVTNTGPALPPEMHHRVVERFFRGDPAHSSSVEGSGLGLSIADSIVKSHQGRLNYTVLEDGRTQVTVCLPLMKVA